MISRKMKELQTKKRDNKGAGLVLVIIAIAFIGMLVAMILYMAYNNFLMKNNDRLAKDNFYSAEYALDVINAGLQLDISEAMSEAYVVTMKNSSGKSSEDMTIEFQVDFLDRLTSKLQYVDDSNVSNPNKWGIKHLTEFLDKNDMHVADAPGNQGVYLGAVEDNNAMVVSDNKDYVTLSNMHIVYTDDRGFVTIITTDLRLRVPDLDFAQSASKMSIENYSLVANDALINDRLNSDAKPDGFDVTKGSQSVAISGNVFGGYKGVEVGKQMRTQFVIAPSDAGGSDDISYNLVADSLNVSDGTLDVDESFNTYVSDINLAAGTLDMNGTAYVGDDMDVAGSGSVVRLSGIYRGYGNMLGTSDGSSSILINGGNTTLDFSGLKELVLSGHAYVGAKKYDADLDRLAHATSTTVDKVVDDKISDMQAYEEKLDNDEYVEKDGTIPQNYMDFMMGESISVKANQLLYMVPAECIGYNIRTGEQVIGKNPMTYSEYATLTDTVYENETDENGNPVKVYQPVNLDKLWTKLGVPPYTNDYEAVYRRVNGTVLVYLYLDFGANETMANAFYKAYYDLDKEGINNYVKAYISDMKWSSELVDNDAAKLSLAGNAFYLNGRTDEVVFLEDDLNDSTKNMNMLRMQEENSKVYEALMHSLTTDINAVSGSEEIFDVLVDETVLANVSGKEFATAGGTRACIVDGNALYPSDACPEDKTKLIVASGDIYIKDDFDGLALAGGNIYICNGCTEITYNPSEVIQAMRSYYTDGVTGEKKYAYEVFGSNGVLTYGMAGSEEENEEVDLKDLILYQNWKKE